jgi:5-methylcytosine-specific restriction endonuclease McrA
MVTVARGRRYGIGKKEPDKQRSVADVINELKGRSHKGSGTPDYRELSLRIHGLVCAKCGREFDYSDRHLLTVHHKDGNPLNNPLDGSNWENLCVYCHNDEHSRGLLGDYFSDKE